jgi:integrase
MSMRTPKYRLHKPTMQAVVTLDGRDIYLGRYGSIESKAEYNRLVAEWLANGRQSPGARGGDIAVNELIAAYRKWAAGYYRKNGEITQEPDNIRLATRPLLDLYGHTLARDFGPLALKTVREAMIKADVCRLEVNRRIGRIVRAFKWAVENELVPPSVHHGLKAVSWLRRGRSEARESPPVRPVAEAFVEAVRPHVSHQVWAMIELQRLTGMRPGEACQMRTCDLDTSGKVWVYTPGSHKTEHHDRERHVYLGPQAQAVLRSWLKTDLAAYLFSPREAMEQRWAEQRRNRKSKVQPSQECRRAQNPEKRPGDCYTTDSYRTAIAKGCDKAGVPHWHPHQLRHNAGTRLRKEFGVDIARIILGHTSPIVTEIYAELDREKALAVVGKIG